MQSINVIAHNMRSTHNVGSLLRTAEGLGIDKVWLTGYTPHPLQPIDERLPHLAKKIDAQITKTALGAEKLQAWEYNSSLETVLDILLRQGYEIAALEQSTESLSLPSFTTDKSIALLLGEEVNGIDTALLKKCSYVLEIPMHGKKESFNVVQSAAMALYQLKYGLRLP